MKPSLNKMVSAYLPPACNISSANDNKENIITNSNKKFKRKHSNELLLEAIQETKNNTVSDKLAKQKNVL
jgi:hypothetical protein